MELSARNFVPEPESTESSAINNGGQGMQEVIPSTMEVKPIDRRDEVVLYLQQDNIRLEQKLRFAHDQLEYYSEELNSKTKLNLILEDKLKIATEQNNNLLTELGRFEAARAVAENQTDDARRVVALQERLAELEQNNREMCEQLSYELRISETKLSIAEETRNQSEKRISQLERSANDWRKKYEEVSQENEALLRANEEVKNLEFAICKMKDEKQMLYQQLNELLDEKRQLEASRNHLSNRINSFESQNEKLCSKIRQLNESFNGHVMKLADKENSIKKLTSQLEKLVGEVRAERLVRAQLEEQNKWLIKQISPAVMLPFDVSSEARGVNVGGVNDSDGYGSNDDSTAILDSATGLAVKHRLPSADTDLVRNKRLYTEIPAGYNRSVRSCQSYFSHELRFRCRRSLKPYICYAWVVYITVLHFLLFRYMFT